MDREAFEITLREAQARGDFSTIATLHREAGEQALRQGDQSKATYHFVRALAAYSQSGDLLGIGAMHVRLGNIALQREQPHIATRHFRRALFAYEESGHEKGLVGVYVGLGHVATMQQRATDAQNYYRRALTLLERDLPPDHPMVQAVARYLRPDEHDERKES